MAENLIQNHAILLKDNVRMEAYKKAVMEIIKPGDVVVDVGCGLGILSFLALQAGASCVHAIEIDRSTLNIAKEIARHNGLDKKIVFHKGLSSKTKLREKANVIICELFGNLGINENLLPVIIDARERLLKEGGRVIPCGIKVWISPCGHKDWLHTANCLHNLNGIDMLPDSPSLDLGSPSVIIKNAGLLAKPVIFADVDLLTTENPTALSEMVFKITRDSVMSGFAGWFEAHLTNKISFSTGPNGPSTHWKQALLPLRVPQNVCAGQEIRLTLEIAPDSSGLNSIIGYRYDVI